MSASSEPPAHRGTAGAAAVVPVVREVRVAREVRLPADLHARPAGRLVRATSGFASRVTLAADQREADARSVLAVMALGATAGTVVTVRAAGPDAQDAEGVVAAVVAVLAQPDGEPTAR